MSEEESESESAPLLCDAKLCFDPSFGTIEHKKKWKETESIEIYNEEHPSIKKAAYLLRDSIILSKSTTTFAHTDYLLSSKSGTQVEDRGIASVSRLMRKILVQPAIAFAVRVSIIGTVLLTFFEPPSWCRGMEGGCEEILKKEGVPLFYTDDTEAKIQSYYPNTGTMLISLNQSFIAESCFVSFLLLHTFLCLAKDKFSVERFFYVNVGRLELDDISKRRMRMASMYRYIRVVTLALLVKGLVTFYLGNPNRPYAAILRVILFITYSEGLQLEIMLVSKIIPAVATIFVGLCMVILFYGLIGVAAFNGTKEGDLHFSSLIEGVWTLFTSMTTVIYPDVMMAGYNENRWVALYFTSFMVLTFFFFQNLVLGTITSVYEENRGEKTSELDLAREDLCKRAFHELAADDLGYVTRQQMMAIFYILNNDCDEIDPIPENTAELLFAILDRDGSEQLEEQEFLLFGNIMLLEFDEYESYGSNLEKHFPFIAEHRTYMMMKSMVNSEIFDCFVDGAVVLNAFFVMVQSYPMLVGQTVEEDPALKDGLINDKWEAVQNIFAILFTLEMICKVAVFGWNRYAASIRNIFDGAITVAAFIATVYDYIPGTEFNGNIIRFIMMARAFRILRFFFLVKEFRQMVKTFLGILPATSRVALLLFVVVYTWSWIGMHFFGGMISRDPSNMYASKLEGTDFAGAFYWANSFNDMFSGANVCFNLLVINNWNEMESGIVAVYGKTSRFFFLTFYIVGVMIVNNIVVALVVDYFLNEFKVEEDEYEEDMLVNERQIIFDADDLCTKRRFEKHVARLNSKFRYTTQASKLTLNKIFANRKKGHDT